MRILYVATDQVVPGSTGGSIHVLEVARGLAARGHEVEAVIHDAGGAPEPQSEGRLTWRRIRWTPEHRFFRLRARPQVERLARAFGAEAVIERYYNFGGEGILTAERLALPSLLEVNSPLVDPAGSLKAALDAALLVRPMRRHRERLATLASALIAPILEIVPAFARGKTEVVTWGANVESFSPARRDDAVRARLGIPASAVAILFSGSFRPWHGVHVFEAAARRLRAREDLFFVLAGGPEAGPASDFRGVRLGKLAYQAMPEVTAACDIGVAPYDTARLRDLSLGFFWSPLKIFEYMASGLPTLTIPRPPLTEIVRDNQEGAFFEEANPDDLARALGALGDDRALRRRLGANARARVVERYSWAKHCEQIETVLKRIAA